MGNLLMCFNCSQRGVPLADGRCPSCQQAMRPGGAVASAPSSGYVQEGPGVIRKISDFLEELPGFRKLGPGGDIAVGVLLIFVWFIIHGHAGQLTPRGLVLSYLSIPFGVFMCLKGGLKLAAGD